MADVIDADNPFEYSIRELKELIECQHDTKQALWKDIGGIEIIAQGLKVDLRHGLKSNDINDLQARERVFGKNYVCPSKPQTILELMWDALQDLTLQVLIVAGILSLILGATVGKHTDTDWIEGIAVLAAVFLVTLVTAINDYKKDQQFRALNAVKEDEVVKVIRDGSPKEINKQSIVVGDVLRIDVGDILPADGIIFDERQIKIDESSMTGESDLIVKDSNNKPFLLSGTKVMEGIAKMLVIAVGPNSQAGIITDLITRNTQRQSNTQEKDDLSGIRVECSTEQNNEDIRIPEVLETELDDDDEDVSPLQGKLNNLTIWIGKAGTAVAVFILVVMVVRYSIETFAVNGNSWNSSYISDYLGMFIVAVTVLVVAIPEGLPLAVTISLAYSVRKMLADNNLVRHLDACETMGNATTICSDKTGTLTTNRMTVVSTWVADTIFSPLPHGMSPSFKDLLCKSICINSTAEILPPKVDGAFPEHTGNKTECALLQFSCDLGVPYQEERSAAQIERLITFSSTRKRMSALVAHDKHEFRLYSKGASEIVLGLCSSYLSLDGSLVPLTESTKQKIIIDVIETFATKGQRTLCLAYRDISKIEVDSAEEELEKDLTCIAIVGIEDPVRPEVPKSIELCRKAGITVRMVTGDNLVTARSIAYKCGILNAGDGALIMEGAEFRAHVLDENGNINQREFDKIWPKLRVLARSSPKDKHTLVSGLIQSNLIAHGPQVVAVTGDGTNDAPALKRADVGFAMGISGTPVAKDASDIILMDDNFSSIVEAVKWGRNVYDSIAKFLLFQLTVNLVAIVLAVIGAIVLADSPLNAIQMLWVNIIMDTFASLALATENPTEDLLNRKPYSRHQPLVSRTMAKHIVGQSLYQLTILLFIVFYGDHLLDIPSGRDHDGSSPTQHYTLVFNTFVWLQLFNEINCRRIHDEKNIFAGILKNEIFLGIAAFQIIVQIFIVEFGGLVFGVAGLTLMQWIYCILLGMGSIPLSFLLRCLQTSEAATNLIPEGKQNFVVGVVTTTRGQELWMRGFHRIRVQIRVVKAFRRGLAVTKKADYKRLVSS